MPKIVDASEVRQRPRKSPAQRMIEQLPKDHLTARDVAIKFDRNIETIRRLARQKNEDGSKKFKAPSKAMVNGELVIWVYTPADVKELAAYFGEQVARPRAAKKKG